MAPLHIEPQGVRRLHALDVLAPRQPVHSGDLFWIVDDSDNGLSSTSAGPGTREIEILPSCTGFRLN